MICHIMRLITLTAGKINRLLVVEIILPNSGAKILKYIGNMTKYMSIDAYLRV